MAAGLRGGKLPTTPEGPHRAIARFVKPLLDRDGRSYAAIAYDAGMDPAGLTNIRRAKAIPKRETCDALAQALNLNPYEHAKLLVLCGYVPHLGSEFGEIVARIAGGWMGGRLTREPDERTMRVSGAA